jgi:hypothetical protein
VQIQEANSIDSLPNGFKFKQLIINSWHAIVFFNDERFSNNAEPMLPCQ